MNEPVIAGVILLRRDIEYGCITGAIERGHRATFYGLLNRSVVTKVARGGRIE